MEARNERRVQTQLKAGLDEASRWMSQPRVAISKLAPLHELLKDLQESSGGDQGLCLRVLLELSSLQIDAACDAADVDEIERGLGWAEEVYNSPLSDERLRGSAAYNLANAISQIRLLAWTENRKQPETKASRRAPFRLKERETVRRTRALLSLTAHSSELPAVVRSMALCNLGNALDESGRWVEAYQCYADALEADPNNGNAAELLRRRIQLGNGLLGHYAALYNVYVRKAKALRPHTVAIAGEATARRWDALKLFDDHGHTSHDGDSLNNYQQWIKKHGPAPGLVDSLTCPRDWLPGMV